MTHSYDKRPRATNVQAPANWTAVRPHKYCGKIDLAGRPGKANKAQKCDECMAIKAAEAKAVQRDTNARRQEKMDWGGGGYGEGEADS
ncbi:hypothetical protein QBC47DRAFT_399210 [Echria macrotheca]|uniref:Uncharacterized protein n=1 Tax=Echria macrotheca TaxID=438768 RepID=A0AAJ0BLX6_9PEZI|nr:hypothetical protein QBC47DRAFT_399210 [Echria macrotheca]